MPLLSDTPKIIYRANVYSTQVTTVFVARDITPPPPLGRFRRITLWLLLLSALRALRVNVDFSSGLRAVSRAKLPLRAYVGTYRYWHILVPASG